MRLEAKRLYLRPLTSEDANGAYPHWLNDSEVCQYNSHGDIAYTKEMALEYIKMTKKNPQYKVFAIVDKKSQKHIGNISLQQINTQNHSAEFAILLGDKDFWGQGYAKEAGQCIIAFGFQILKLNTIYCGTNIKNIPMQHLAIALDMKLFKVTNENYYYSLSCCSI